MHPSIKFRATGRLYRVDNLHKTFRSSIDDTPAPLSGRLPRIMLQREPSTASREGFVLQVKFLSAPGFWPIRRKYRVYSAAFITS